MKLHSLEFILVNNALRAASRRRIETPRLIGPRGSLAAKRVLEIGCGWGVGVEILLSLIGRWLRSRAGLTLIAFLAIAAFFLVTGHTAHFFGILPYALLLLCPLLHLFMHSGHADHQAVEERQ